jgi:hypothetical protein
MDALSTTDDAPQVTTRDLAGALVPAALASAGAGLIHASAVGIHSEHVGLTRIFIFVAVAQLGVALMALLRPSARWAGAALVAVNLAAFGGWLYTRLGGISWISGLEQSARSQPADTVAAILALGAVVGTAPFLIRRTDLLLRVPVVGFAILIGVLTVPAMVNATSHQHDAGGDHALGHGDHGDGDHADGDHGDGGRVDPLAALGGRGDHDDGKHDGDHDGHHDDGKHSDGEHSDGNHASDDVAFELPVWPRPWDPSEPIDFSGVPGVAPEQQARAEQLVAETLEVLPRFADVTTIGELGYRSIGDARTGFEHFINRSLIADDTWLDPSAPESLVYRVEGDERVLVSAMFIVGGRAIDDPELVDYGGPLMEWHVHDNLCWGLDDNGTPVVKAVTDNHGGTCPPGTVLAGGDAPMVHVWITPHLCGPFAALEGHGAGQAAGDDSTRADLCHHDDGHGGHGEPDGATVAPKPYDPTLPIDLSGVEGVTLQQQAFAEQLVAVTLRYLPKWEDPAVAEAAGFRSIGDGGTGHEHYVNWEWIDDDVWLDPLFPESLVYEPQPDGTKKLVSAMYMLPSDTALDDVPDWGGRLMQWHIHDDLCFSTDPTAPRVAGITTVGGACPPSLVKFDPAPMIHVWIRPHECGPFAALDGIGAGQVVPGEEHFCNHAHGTS